ncbi:MAG: V-type ATPase 116kDa subunit family protein [Spirochaetia bacterium]|nr:hypothetical protein [Spirochaetota bacterium]MDW8112598.1 V-type ATPase 116kDa subunit family protein [Spirochaetia bacterium]
MLFPEKMTEITILTTEDYLRPISDYLMKFGEFEVKPVRTKDAAKLTKLSKGKDTDNERFSNLKTRLDRLSVNMGIDEKTIKSTLNERETLSFDEIDARLSKIENRFYYNHSLLEELEKEEVELRLRKLKYQIRENIKARNLPKEFFVAIIVVAKYETQPVIKNLSTLPSVVEEVEAFGDLSVILVSLPQAYKNEVLKLSTSFLKLIDISEVLKETIDIEQVERKLREVEIEKKKMKSIIEKIRETDTEEILTLYKGLWFVNSSLKIKSSSIRGGKLILFSGWIPAKHKEEVSRKITEITDGISVIETNDAEKIHRQDKQVVIPTKLNNPKQLSSFESLVKLYAIPRFYEVDPTIIFAFLYVLFYGMMFGDVGQGLALSLVSALLFWKFKGFRVVSGLGIAVGISAAIFGFLYGSVFGIEEKIIPAMWTSPLHDVLKLMKVSIAIGFIVISVGLILNIINTSREGNIPKLLLSSKGISGLIFYTSLIGYPIYLIIFGGTFNVTIMLLGVGIPILLFVVESVIESVKHHHKVSPVTVFFELFEVFISFVSNTISFIRIAGFALNHTALMITFFSIANVISGTTIGDIIGFFVIVFGQIFIIGFEGFIVGIQALRLSFYEFFTKFFRGGGKVFEPVK